ncbi:acetyltransferase [Sphingomonas sp. AAP5]|nr:acetyltransferase [Sphingomonas sp. AAP5]
MSVQSQDIVVLGAGGHAKVVIDLLRETNWRVVALTDADDTARTVMGVPVVGTDEKLEELWRNGIRAAFVALGSNALRERIGDRLLARGFALPAAVSTRAAVSPSAQIGQGVAVMAGAAINAEAVIGDFAIVNTQAGVDHDCVIGRGAHIGPGSALAGCVRIGARSFLGVGCNVIPEKTIGSDVMVGAGSLVIRDLPDGCLAFGAPAVARR